MKRCTVVLMGAAILFVGFCLSYVLPQVSVVEVVGVEVKRTDPEQGTHGIYLIRAQQIDGGVVRVFRPEDAWLYRKFDTATLQALVAGLSRGQGAKPVAARHYGWRIPVLFMFPNAISAQLVELGYQHIPLFNIAVIGFLIAGLFMVWRVVRNPRARFSAASARQAKERAIEAVIRNIPPVISAGHKEWLLKYQPSSGRLIDPGRSSRVGCVPMVVL